MLRLRAMNEPSPYRWPLLLMAASTAWSLLSIVSGQMANALVGPTVWALFERLFLFPAVTSGATSLALLAARSIGPVFGAGVRALHGSILLGVVIATAWWLSAPAANVSAGQVIVGAFLATSFALDRLAPRRSTASHVGQVFSRPVASVN